MGAAVERNRLLQELAAFCEGHPIDEKILLAPSFAVGTQVLDALARSGCAHLNLRPATPFSLALDVAGPLLAADRRRLLSRAQLLAVVESACDEVLKADSYFGRLRERVGLHRALHRTLDELRRAGVAPGALPPEAFEDARKAKELAALARAFDATLEKLGAADAAEVFDRAARACAEPSRRIPASVHVLRPAGLELAPLEERFLASCAPVTVPLAEDAPETGVGSPALTFSHALSEENEVRAVFRRILDEGLRLDDVEIAFDDDTTYRPLVHELSSQYGVSCTFDDGIPVTYTRPGQGILDYLDWVAHDFRVAALERLFADGRADLKPFQPASSRVGGIRAARLLRRARIFAGAPRYAPRLDALVERERLPEPEVEPDGARGAARAERLAAAETLRSFVTRLFGLTPKITRARVSLPALAAACREVVREMLTRASELDGAAAEALARLFQQLAELPERTLSSAEAADRLREAVVGLAVVSSTPMPGHVHVARLSRAGHSARPWTFVLGLDESRFPGPPRQDPVLLDSERDALNRTLPAASHLGLPGRTSTDEKRLALRALLARVRGKVDLSFSNRDILQDAERFPSPVLLQLFREREGTPEAGYDSLARSLGAPATFVPSGAPLDETEWWLAGVRAAAGAPGLGAEVERAYPWLAEGARAEAARAERGLHALGRAPLRPRGRPGSAQDEAAPVGLPSREAREVPPDVLLRVRARPVAARRRALRERVAERARVRKPAARGALRLHVGPPRRGSAAGPRARRRAPEGRRRQEDRALEGARSPAEPRRPSGSGGRAPRGLRHLPSLRGRESRLDAPLVRGAVRAEAREPQRAARLTRSRRDPHFGRSVPSAGTDRPDRRDGTRAVRRVGLQVRRRLGVQGRGPRFETSQRRASPAARAVPAGRGPAPRARRGTGGGGDVRLFPDDPQGQDAALQARGSERSRRRDARRPLRPRRLGSLPPHHRRSRLPVLQLPLDLRRRRRRRRAGREEERLANGPTRCWSRSARSSGEASDGHRARGATDLPDGAARHEIRTELGRHVARRGRRRLRQDDDARRADARAAGGRRSAARRTSRPSRSRGRRRRT